MISVSRRLSASCIQAPICVLRASTIHLWTSEVPGIFGTETYKATSRSHTALTMEHAEMPSLFRTIQGARAQNRNSCPSCLVLGIPRPLVRQFSMYEQSMEVQGSESPCETWKTAREYLKHPSEINTVYFITQLEVCPQPQAVTKPNYAKVQSRSS